MHSQNKLGETALHVAAKYGRIKSVKLLLEKGADIQIKVGQNVRQCTNFRNDNIALIDSCRTKRDRPHTTLLVSTIDTSVHGY